MPITTLNHYFVRANDLEASRAFYCDVLGFEQMPRPDFPFPGYWLGIDGQIQVHMGPHGIENSELYYLGTGTDSATTNSGVVDHIAFLATEPERMYQSLRAKKVPLRLRHFAQFKLFQMFVVDPNGLTIELNFFGVDDQPSWAEGAESYADMPAAAPAT
jgi:catechol 2,3-dioxygenase-like lactoylglutathione lyase family enzyme